jgi:hypothetical protein
MLNVTIYLGSTTPSSNRAGPRAPLAPLSPSPAARRAPPVRVIVARHCCRDPPFGLTPPPLFGRQRAHDARRARPPGSGRCRPGAASRSARTHPCSCRFLHTSVALPDPPSDSSLRRPPLKRAPCRPATELFSPARRLSHPTTPERRTDFPTDPASASSAFRCRRPSPAPDSVQASPSYPLSSEGPPSFVIP